MPGDPRPETPESGPAPQKIEVVPIEDAPPPPSSGGCASGADDTTPLWLFVLLLLLVERQRHRRPHWVRRRLAGVGDYKEEGASEETSAWVEKTWVA